MGYGLVVCATVITCGDLFYCIVSVINDVSISRRERTISAS